MFYGHLQHRTTVITVWDWTTNASFSPRNYFDFLVEDDFLIRTFFGFFTLAMTTSIRYD